MISEMDIAIRLGVAFLLGAIIGVERELDNQPAGLRTNIILVMGSALAMIISVSLAHVYQPVGGMGDPARLAAQAGVNIRGLTTAATLWTMAVVGLAVGAGFFSAAVIVTITLFIVLSVMNKLENKLFHPKTIAPITMWIKDGPPDLAEVRKIFAHKHVHLITFSHEHDFTDDETKINLEYSCKRVELIDEIQKNIYAFPGLRKVHFGKAVQI